MGTELQLQESRPLTAVEIRAQVNLIQEVLRGVMKKDTHYGTIPGTPKPTLYMPGAEQLLVTFRIAPLEPKVEDLSTTDAIRYRVTQGGQSIISGNFVGAGAGECSSDEEKFKWRRPVCDAEFDDTPENRRRFKYKRDGTKDKQVRTNPADVANTILKMAVKRAYVAMALHVTAASDIFSQDLEDLPAEIAESIAGEQKPVYEMPKAAPAKAPASGPVEGDLVLSFVPAAYNSKPGTSKAGKAYVSHSVKNGGEWLSTFSDTDGAIMKQAFDEKRTLRVGIKMNGAYKNIVSAEIV